MAQYLGRVQGSRGSAQRLGGKPSGMTAHANGWHVGGKVEMRWNEELQRDEVIFTVTGGSSNPSDGRFVAAFYKTDSGYKQIPMLP